MILVLEDDVAVRTLLCTVLRKRGYSVASAGTAEEAFEIAAGSESPIRLLITDVVLPRRSGLHVAIQLRRSIPGLRVLVISGYDFTAGRYAPEWNELPADCVVRLNKPFSPDALLNEVVKLVGPATG